MVIIKSIKLSSDGIIYQYKYRLREEFSSTQPNYYWTFTTNLKLWTMISFLTFNSQDLSAQPASAQCICWTWSWLCSIRAEWCKLPSSEWKMVASHPISLYYGYTVFYCRSSLYLSIWYMSYICLFWKSAEAICSEKGQIDLNHFYDILKDILHAVINLYLCARSQMHENLLLAKHISFLHVTFWWFFFFLYLFLLWPKELCQIQSDGFNLSWSSGSSFIFNFFCF